MDYGLSRAQASYDAQESREGVRRCACGLDFDDHITPGDLADDPQVLLEALNKIDKLLGKPDSLGRIQEILDKTLNVAQVAGRECRGFEPIDPGDDDDQEFDRDYAEHDAQVNG